MGADLAAEIEFSLEQLIRSLNTCNILTEFEECADCIILFISIKQNGCEIRVRAVIISDRDHRLRRVDDVLADLVLHVIFQLIV